MVKYMNDGQVFMQKHNIVRAIPKIDMTDSGLDPSFWEHFTNYFMDTIFFHYQYLSPSPPFLLLLLI